MDLLVCLNCLVSTVEPRSTAFKSVPNMVLHVVPFLFGLQDRMVRMSLFKAVYIRHCQSLLCAILLQRYSNLGCQ